VGGRTHWEMALAEIDSSERPVWFHCASVGEFEQARPVIEKIKRELVGSEVVVTFFSPSGFEFLKSYPLADVVTYLPTDLPRNVDAFLNKLNPSVVVFVKYEFWLNFMKAISNRSIASTLICADFPKNYSLLKWPGVLIGRRLNQFTKIFAQNAETKSQLNLIGMSNVSVAGDTRFDRVIQNKSEAFESEKLEAFFDGRKILVIGSNWPEDDRILIPEMLSFEGQIVVVPHEINSSQLVSWSADFGDDLVCWSENDLIKFEQKKVLFIDAMGLLSKLYSKADIAYVGGGFGSAVHNTLEAAVFGIPVIFGPNNHRFSEIQELKKREIGIEVVNRYELRKALLKGLSNYGFRSKVEESAREFFDQNIGATDVVFDWIKLQLKNLKNQS
jgi:3-deoxy-D-manno-octulosonic-acid transferase